MAIIIAGIITAERMEKDASLAESYAFTMEVTIGKTEKDINPIHNCFDVTANGE